MKKQLLNVFLFLLTLTALQSCKKEDDQHPEIQTVEITPLSASRAIFKGNIVNKGKFKILDYGFVYSENSMISETYGTKVSLGKEPSEGAFSKEVQGLNSNMYSSSRTIFMRAYITNDQGTAFGEIISADLPYSTATSVTPALAKSGEIIAINGSFPSVVASDVSARIGNVNASVVGVTSTKIQLQVPSGIQGSHNTEVPINLNIAGQQINLGYFFRIAANIKDFNPKSGPIGTLITFTGDNLPSYYYSSNGTVRFGTTDVPVQSYTSAFQVYVPSTVTQSSLPVSVNLNGNVTDLPTAFTVTPHAVSALSTTTATTGAPVTVYLTNYPQYSAVAQVKIGTETLNVNVYNSNQFSFNVPFGLSPGDYTISVKIGPFTADAPSKLKVQAPNVTGFSPTSGAVGREINISGLFLPGQYYNVYFGSTYVSGYTTSSSNLRTSVPYGIEAGKVKISIKIDNQTLYATDDFTVIGPAISSFSPSSGVAGTIVTITGEGFSQYSSNLAVKFGTINAIVNSVTETSIRATVPSNLNPGAMKITVVSNGQTVVSTNNFTVTN